jgi:hypothetical protein
MAVLDAPPHHELSTVEGGKASVRAQRFLDVLQGAFQLTWERPEELRQAMSELSTSEEAKAGLRVLWEYLEALSPSLSSLCGVGAREGEGEGGAARQAKDRRKRRKRGSRSNTSGTGVGDVSEVSRGGSRPRLGRDCSRYLLFSAHRGMSQAVHVKTCILMVFC